MGLKSEWEQNLLQYLTASSTKKEWETVAQILVEAYQERSFSAFPDDMQRLRGLAAEGWHVLPASSHAANNCLLDSLLLAMLARDVAPGARDLSKGMRANLCRSARQHLRAHVDPSVVSINGLCTFLDAHRHGPAAVQFLYGELLAVAGLPQRRPNFEIRVYSRFDSVEVNPENLGIQIPGEEALGAPFQILRLYNHTLPDGSGYHFDALSGGQWHWQDGGTYQNEAVDTDKDATCTSSAGTSTQCRNTATANKRCRTSEAGDAANSARRHADGKQRHNDDKPSSGTNTNGAIDAAITKRQKVRQPAAKKERQPNSPDLNQLRIILQNFFCARSSSPLLVSESDAKEVAAAWFATEALALKLHTLLQSELDYADNGMHNARRLLDQFCGYYNACTTGAPKKLGTLQRQHTDRCGSSAKAENDDTQPKKITKEEHARDKTWIPERRLRRKTAAPKAPLMEASNEKEIPTMANCEPDENAPFILRVSGLKEDPRAQLEKLIQSKACLIREHPTLPCEFKETSFEPVGFDLPPTHCAFKGCHFAAATENDVVKHVTEEHAAALQCIVDSPIFPVVGRPAFAHAYSLLLTSKCQENPPVANCSIDRRCLRTFRTTLTMPDLQELVCFVCARRYPYVPNAPNPNIAWRGLHDENGDILRCKQFESLLTLSLEGYRSTYMVQSPLEVQATMREELEEWACQFQCGAMSIDVLCCPEDKRCLQKCGPRHACRQCQCEAPICVSCWGCLGQQKCPPEALANDMMIFYAPKEIYEHQVTFMELVCASPCITTMVCFSLEKKYRQHRMFDQEAFMNEFRVAARGNATTFPLPWENLLDILGGTLNNAGPAAPLPHIGPDLKNFVSVILKSNDPIENPDSLSKFIHQAVVRRQVVIDLILGALERGHRGYQHLNSESVKLRAQSLPVNGVPAEVVAVMSNDGHLGHIKRSKAAAPVAEEQSLADVLAEFTCSMKPNAVVNEKSVTGHGDHEAMTKAALHHISEMVEPKSATVQTLKIKTGQQVLDQFEPWYFGVAFAFVFKYCLGMPDLPAWSKKPRWRRPQSAPHIGLASWTRAMARRIEAQINRDWTFGFASWNLLFRSAVNLARTIDSYEVPVYDEESNTYRKLSPQDLEHGALQLVAALQGSYKDMSGKMKPVKGDISKLSYVPSLKPAARKILKNARHVARGVPGTQEARRQMRFEIEAMRMRYGVPLFVTFSPATKHIRYYLCGWRVRARETQSIVPAGLKIILLATRIGQISPRARQCPSMCSNLERVCPRGSKDDKFWRVILWQWLMDFKHSSNWCCATSLGCVSVPAVQNVIVGTTGLAAKMQRVVMPHTWAAFLVEWTPSIFLMKLRNPQAVYTHMPNVLSNVCTNICRWKNYSIVLNKTTPALSMLTWPITRMWHERSTAKETNKNYKKELLRRKPHGRSIEMRWTCASRQLISTKGAMKKRQWKMRHVYGPKNI